MGTRLTRAPQPALRPFVESLWLLDGPPDAGPGSCRREHVLPTGRMHLVLRLTDDPLRVYADDRDRAGRIFSRAVVGGARARFYVRDVSAPLCSVGALLRPGAAEVLFGAHAGELAGRHTALADLWGRRVESMRDQLAATPSPAHRLDLFERMLAARLPRARALHPAVAQALARLPAAAPVSAIVRESGYSHRTLVALFSQSVGLTPKVYSRLLRFERALRTLRAPAAPPWTEVAAAAGYSDQSHFVREFLEFTGVTPTQYRRSSPAFPHHVAVGRR